MSLALRDLLTVLPYWVHLLEGYVVSLLESKSANRKDWIEKLNKEAFFREQVTSLAFPALMLLGSELFDLAVANSAQSHEFDDIRFAIDQLRPEWEHNLQISCSLYSFQLSRDILRQNAKKLYTDREEDLNKVLETWLRWRKDKADLQEHLVKITNQYPFPGQCSACNPASQ